MKRDYPIANCGCVYHAEEGIPCEHDLALAEQQRAAEAKKDTAASVVEDEPLYY